MAIAPGFPEAMICPTKRLIWVMPPDTATGAASHSMRLTPGVSRGRLSRMRTPISRAATAPKTTSAPPPHSPHHEGSRPPPSASSQTPMTRAAMVARFKRIGASAAAMKRRCALSMPLAMAVSDMQMR